MRRVTVAVVSVLALASLRLVLPSPARAAEGDAKSFKGEIMDDMCAQAGSHAEMQKQMKNMGNDSKTCTVECVKLGGKYVLYDAASKKSYQLDPQDKAQDFAGQKVKVTGTSEGGTIHIKSIAPAS